MIPDPHERTVKIPVQWIDGEWQLIGGGALPKLKDRSVADLVMPALFLADPEDVEHWTQEATHSFLPQGSEVFIRVSAQKVPADLLKKTVEKHVGRSRSRFVKVVLNGDLSINIVPGKMGKLNDCPCSIPDLDATAESVNEAYKKIATAFQPSRRSNSGNIFLLAFVERKGRFVELGQVRDETLSRPIQP